MRVGLLERRHRQPQELRLALVLGLLEFLPTPHDVDDRLRRPDDRRRDLADRPKCAEPLEPGRERSIGEHGLDRLGVELHRDLELLHRHGEALGHRREHAVATEGEVVADLRGRHSHVGEHLRAELEIGETRRLEAPDRSRGVEDLIDRVTLERWVTERRAKHVVVRQSALELPREVAVADELRVLLRSDLDDHVRPSSRRSGARRARAVGARTGLCWR